MNQTTTAATLDEEIDARLTPNSAGRDKFDALVERLSEQSIVKRYDAYADIPWDDPAFAIDPDDPRWELATDDALGGTRLVPGPADRRSLPHRPLPLRQRDEDRAAVREHPQARTARARFACPTATRPSATPTTRSSRRRNTG